MALPTDPPAATRNRAPSNLYIRVDRDLRPALKDGAKTPGENVSSLVRRMLRQAVDTPDRDPPPSAPVAPIPVAA